MKAAVLILSDPKFGQEEATGRVFNALAVAYDFKQKGDEVRVFFQGTGTRWITELGKPDNPVHDLFEAVKDKVVGASSGCADVFGTFEEIKQSDFDLVSENQIPGTTGLPSLHKMISDGYTILTF